MSLQSLTDFNAQRSELHQRLNLNEPVKNGIACPGCGEELWDSYPNIVLTSNPPQKNTHCSSCEYVGFRIS